MTGVQAFIGLGSNLGEPEQQLASAIQAIEAHSAIAVLAISPFYRSVAIGPAGQPDYCNAVIEVSTSLEPLPLLDSLQGIEAAHGRDRASSERWGPRTLDLDILLYGDEQVNETRLAVPHAEMLNRNFVLHPLADIAADLLLSEEGTAREWADRLGDTGLSPWRETSL